MRALIVYESMYGNTHVVADHIADGLRSHFEIEVVPVEQATAATVAGRRPPRGRRPDARPQPVEREDRGRPPRRRRQARRRPHPRSRRRGRGLRDWFHPPGVTNAGAAAFDTRIDAAAWLTGRASKGIERRLTHLGYDLVADPESFLVDKQNHLLAGEADAPPVGQRARREPRREPVAADRDQGPAGPTPALLAEREPHDRRMSLTTDEPTREPDPTSVDLEPSSPWSRLARRRRDWWTLLIWAFAAVALFASAVAIGFGMRAIDESKDGGGDRRGGRGAAVATQVTLTEFSITPDDDLGVAVRRARHRQHRHRRARLRDPGHRPQDRR